MGRIVPVIQGSSEWADLRHASRPASLTAVVLGFKKGESRQSLVRMMASGSEKEFSDFVRDVLFENGHTAERNGRPNAEEIIGDELSPLTYIDDETRLLASLDGITEREDQTWECKLGNADLTLLVDDGIIPDSHWPQVEQGLFCSGAKRCLFTVCDIDGNILAKMWYSPVPGRIEKIIAAWDQFEHDVANYQHVEVAEKPVAGPVLDLPAVSVSVSGQIAVIDNLEKFGFALRDFVDTQLVKDPQTDQDFADLEAQIKTLKKAEDALDSAEKMALSQIESIETMQRVKAMLYKLARDNRLAAEKAVKDQKEKVRIAIRNNALEEIKKVVATKNKFLGGNYVAMPAVKVEEKMKGKKTIQTLHDAAADAVADAVVEINQVADRVAANLAYLQEVASESGHLFTDIITIATKKEDDFIAVVTMRLRDEKDRIAKAEAEAEARARAKVEAEMRAKADAEAQAIAKIEAEQKAKADAEAKAKADAEYEDRVRAEEEAKKDKEEESASLEKNESLENWPVREKSHRSQAKEALFACGLNLQECERVISAIESGKIPYVTFTGGEK